jgi:hypothetical protein
MSTSQKKTAPGRTSRGGVADLTISRCAREQDYSNTESDASVYDGRTLIGLLIDEPKQCAALSPDRFLIGLFPDRKSATHAIQIHHQTVSAAA